MRISVVAIHVLLMIIVPISSHAALQNTDKKVKRIDITKDTVIIWIDEPGLIGQSEACDDFSAVSCPVSEKYCDFILGTALAAKLANKKVEFNYSTLCNSGFADAGRFRMME